MCCFLCQTVSNTAIRSFNQQYRLNENTRCRWKTLLFVEMFSYLMLAVYICEKNSVWQVVLIICIKSMKGAHLCLQQQPEGVITQWVRAHTHTVLKFYLRERKIAYRVLFIIIWSCWFALIIAGLGFALLSVGDVGWQKGEAQSEKHQKRQSFISSSPHPPRQSFSFCPLFKFS